MPLPPLIPRRVLFGNPTRLQPRLSPDGRRLAWLAPDEGVLNVFVSDDLTARGRAVTRDRHRGVRSFFWSPAGDRILFLQDRDGDEDWHLWSADPSGGEAVDLTPFHGVQAGLVASHPACPAELLVSLNRRDPRLKDVYRLDLERRRLDEEARNPGRTAGWLADRSLNVRGRQDARPDGGFELLVRDGAGGGWRTVAEWPMHETTGAIGFSEGGDALYLADSRERDTAALVRLDLATRTTRVIAEDPGHDLADVLRHRFSGEPQIAFWDKDRRAYRVLDRTIAGDWERAVALDHGDPSLVSRDDADRLWLVAFLQDTGPVRYHLLDRTSGEARFLFEHREDLDGYRLAPMEPVRIPASDGVVLPAYLTRPPGGGEEPGPMVLLVHGGPWARDTWGFNPIVQWLANRGYAVLQVNFRGSTGFGKRFLHAGDKEWGRRMQQDLTDAVRWAVERRIADPGRVGIMGGSYGGYAVLAGVTFTPGLYRAAVDIVGPSSLFTLIASIPPYWEPVKARFLRQVGDPERDEEMLRERSPLYHVERIRTPLLIAQGANDPRVKRAESEQIVRALREAGKEVQYVLYPDEGHGFVRPENRLQFYGLVEAFFARHLGGRAEPIAAEPGGATGRIDPV